MLSIYMTLLSGPVAGNEVCKMLEFMDGQRDAQIREYNDADDEIDDEKLKLKGHI